MYMYHYRPSLTDKVVMEYAMFLYSLVSKLGQEEHVHKMCALLASLVDNANHNLHC